LNSRVLATVISVFKSKQNYLQQGFGKLPWRHCKIQHNPTQHTSRVWMCKLLSETFFWRVELGFELRASWLYCLSHTSSSFCCGHFGGGVLQTICPWCSWTMIILISASQVSRITGVSHSGLALSDSCVRTALGFSVFPGHLGNYHLGIPIS
jgi:hypothetical protein